MNKTKVAIVEDEMIIAETLQDILEECGYEVTGIYMRAIKALEAFKQNTPDFALLDIQLKGQETGIWLAQQIKEDFAFPYIFLTSFGDKKTVADAAATSPYGFLMKPVEKQNVYAAIEVALKKHAELNQQSNQVESENKPTDNIVLKDALFVKDEYYFTKVKFDDILFIKANGNYLEIYTDIKKLMIKGSLKSFGTSLPSNIFFQTHRSYTVNLRKIDGFGATTIRIGNHEIPVSKTSKDDFMKMLQTYQVGGE